MQIKKGNYIILQIGIKDQDNNYITDLNIAIEVLYMIKNNKTDLNDDALVIKKMTLGEITINDPSTGYVSIELESSDTENIQAGIKYHAVQIEYSAENIKEIWLKDDLGTDMIDIYQDVIRK